MVWQERAATTGSFGRRNSNGLVIAAIRRTTSAPCGRRAASARTATAPDGSCHAVATVGSVGGACFRQAGI